MKKLIMLTALISNIAMADTLSVNAQIPNQYCHVMQWCKVLGKHDIQIINTTNEPHDYSYNYRICDIYGKCKDMGERVTVPPNSKFYNHGDNYIEVRFLQSGKFQMYNYTTILGYQSNKTQGGNVITTN